MSPSNKVLPLIKIGPSILNSNLANLSHECKHLLKCGTDYLHLDVMDGHFVPNLTFGHGTVKCLRQDLGPEPFFDVHMMVSKPLQWIEPMADAGCTQYTYHYEAAAPSFPSGENENDNVIRKIRESGMRVGLAINPETNVDVLFPYCDKVDMILVMTVRPGFGGQKFMGNMMPKIATLRAKYKELDIGVDGGIGPSTAGDCCTAGANMIVAGTSLTRSEDPASVVKQLREIAALRQRT